MVDVNSVGSSSFDPWTPEPDDDERRRPAAPSRNPAPPRAPSELYDLPDANGPLLARAAAAPHLLLAANLRAADVAPVIDSGLGTVPLLKRMDAFMAAAKATYHLPGEGDVEVAARFRLKGKENLTPEERENPEKVRRAAIETGIRTRTPELQAIGAKVGVAPGRIAAVQVGRGTPEEVRRLTQGLIDAKKLPEAENEEDTPERRVQRLMFDYGIGFDCAGYVQQAFTAAHGITRAQAGFAPRVADERLLDPAAKGPFRRVPPEQAQAGDLIVLKAPPGQAYGHTLLVYSRQDLQPEERSSLHGAGPEDKARYDSGRISIFEVHSSFGSGALPNQGGVESRKWIYDAATDAWGKLANDGHFYFTGLPYDGQHELGGVYHYLGGR
jgi:hypothetical protein